MSDVSDVSDVSTEVSPKEAFQAFILAESEYQNKQRPWHEVTADYDLFVKILNNEDKLARLWERANAAHKANEAHELRALYRYGAQIQRARHQSPKYKKQEAKRRQTPEYKAYRSGYDAKRNKTPERRAKLNEYNRNLRLRKKGVAQ